MKQQNRLHTQELSLKQLGWTEFFQQQIDAEGELIPARVIRQDLNRYHLVGEKGILTAILPGRTRIETDSKAELPTVGDWVLISPVTSSVDDPVVIQKTLLRTSKFSRKEAGEKFDEQVVAANVDTVFIVTGLDDNFNPGRIERYLVLAWNSGATPVIVMNKADICEDLQEKLDQINAVAMGTPVHTVSALSNTGMEGLKTYMAEGITVAVLGSSGVGKSTIINQLLGHEYFETGEVREGDSKGRHTTTHRELCMTDDGGLVIDTPGMREIQFWADEDTLATSFEDVEVLACQCKFTDCGHDSEPGCAIQAALESGTLTRDRLDSYYKFQRELVHFAAKADASLKIKKKNERKKIAKFIRNRADKRD